MIEKIRFIIAMCTFGTTYASIEVQEDVYRLLFSLLGGLISLILVYKIQTWQTRQHSQIKQMDLQEPNSESSTTI